MNKEKSNGLKAIEELRKSFDYQTWVLSRLDIIENELKEYEGAKSHIEALTKERIDNDLKYYLFEIIKKNCIFSFRTLNQDRFESYIVEITCGNQVIKMFVSKEEYETLKNILR